MKNKYKCCFCTKEIKTTNIDVTSLIVISNWDKSKGKQHEQQLFCHMECLKKHVNSKVPLYVSDIYDE